MLKSLLAILLLSCTYAAACQSHLPITDKLNKSNWKMSRYKCPHGCSNILKNLLEKQLGQTIDFEKTTPWVSGTSDACYTLPTIQTKTMDTSTLVEEINSTVLPLKAINAKELDLPISKVLVADLLCVGKENQKISYRFIQDKNGHLLTIDEEASILIYE